MNLKANWNYPTAVRFGAGRAAELGEAAAAAGMTRPLIVTDTGHECVDNWPIELTVARP